MLTQVGLLALEGAPGERAACARTLPAPPDPLGDTSVPPRVAGGRPGCCWGAAGPGGGGQGNAVPSSIPGGGPWAGRGLSPGCPPCKAAVGLGAGCSPWPRGLPGVSAFPYLSQKSRRCELCEPWAGTSCAALGRGGGQGRSPFQLVMGCPKMCPPPPVPPAGCGSGRGTLGCRSGPRMGVIWGDFHNLQDFIFVFF